jgi:hypothetical protein
MQLSINPYKEIGQGKKLGKMDYRPVLTPPFKNHNLN